MGDISVVRPLSRVESAFSVLIGVTLLGERLAPREGFGVFTMIAGALVLTLEPEPERAFVPDAASTALALGTAGALADIMMKLGTSVVKETTGTTEFTWRRSI
jgi:hypothetical protein